MSMHERWYDLMNDLWSRNRTIAGPEMVVATEMIAGAMDPLALTPRFAAGEEAFTWHLPASWIGDGYLVDKNGQRWLDCIDNPLHIASHSVLPNGMTDIDVTWEELSRHLAVAERGVPWRYHFYQPAWTFCLDRQTYDRMPRGDYHVRLRTEFGEDGIVVATNHLANQIDGQPADELWLQGHLCHPRQANDGLSGVIVALEVWRRICARPPAEPHLDLRIFVGPETVGTLAYLARHRMTIPRVAGAIFVETAGLQLPLLIQDEKNEFDLGLGDLAYSVCHREACQIAWRTGPINDELVWAMPGIDRPAISFSRWDMERGAFPQYHTDADNMALIDWDKMEETASAVEKTVRAAMHGLLVPKPKFIGPVQMARYGLWEEFGGETADRVMACMDGQHTHWQLHYLARCSLEEVYAFSTALYKAGLVEYANHDLRTP